MRAVLNHGYDTLKMLRQHRLLFSIGMSAVVFFLAIFLFMASAPAPVSACDGTMPCEMVLPLVVTEDPNGGGSTHTNHKDDADDASEPETHDLNSDVGVTSEEVHNLAPALEPALCSTHNSHVNLNADGILMIFSGATTQSPYGLLIDAIPLTSIHRVTDAERAKGEPIGIATSRSKLVDGWHIGIYWDAGFYGVHIFGKDDTFGDDTGAVCTF